MQRFQPSSTRLCWSWKSNSKNKTAITLKNGNNWNLIANPSCLQRLPKEFYSVLTHHRLLLLLNDFLKIELDNTIN